MKALVIRRTGPPETLCVEDWPKPALKPGQILIKVKAAGVNFADCLARMGLYSAAPKRPFIPGYEAAGIIEEVGREVSNFKPGDRVFGATRFGGCAEFAAVDSAQALAIPESLSFEQAAAIPVNYLTAYAALYEQARVRKGDLILIHSAAGGVGIAAMQLCQATGATVVAMASSDVKLERLRAMGAEHTINTNQTNYPDTARKLANYGDGFDVILNAAGGPTIRQDLRLLAPGGRLILYGISSLAPLDRRRWLDLIKGFISTPWLHPLWLINNNKGVFGLNMAHYFKNNGVYKKIMEDIAAMVQKGEIKPVLDSNYPLDKAPQAHARLHSRQNVGKVVLVF
ncbi:MAG: medium chain dehydrogenase/reductase family protein [Elusimicrobiota bacterium]